MGDVCEGCGELRTQCVCIYDVWCEKEDAEIAFTTYRELNGDVFLAFGNYDDYIKWIKEQK